MCLVSTHGLVSTGVTSFNSGLVSIHGLVSTGGVVSTRGLVSAHVPGFYSTKVCFAALVICS